MSWSENFILADRCPDGQWSEVQKSEGQTSKGLKSKGQKSEGQKSGGPEVRKTRSPNRQKSR